MPDPDAVRSPLEYRPDLQPGHPSLVPHLEDGPIERLESLLDGIQEAFAYFGGVVERVVLDNTSIAVKKVLAGTEREQTEAFDAGAALEGLNATWHTRDVLFKYHAACYGTHAPIEAAMRLR